jgi:hypothetical protein
LLGKKLIGSAFASCCDCNGRRRRGIEILHDQPNYASKADDRDEDSQQSWMRQGDDE